ncbi:hypothetical protein [Clostridium estertheticum]|uniref:hypothetical protein n=1 Tax=Clostridium estertheticum TaxID=238834 RepID=UPI001C7DDA58|nr:hypothetical protein [Clostridium estertheticum]MBX4264205.1 hypothetical protein [Clostridium estertheticum]MBX4267772.1 hypothetical protein [Clostridium estertheticum]WLC78016.1 hypothetical protein KTC98_12225 [Clostridium estertheticum]WLC89062.1 hypothetical protein KTC95_02175 [Clostridium estertheticum]
MFYFVGDVEENVMNVNNIYEVPFLEEAIYNMSLEKMINEYENIKKWFMINKMANNFKRKGVAGEELEFFLIDYIPYEELDYTHDVLNDRIKQKMGLQFEEYEYFLKLKLSGTCSRILFNVKVENILKEWS